MIYLTLLLGKLLSDPSSLPAVQQERARMHVLGGIAKAAYLMGVKDTLTVVIFLAVILGLLFFFPASRSRQDTPGENPPE